jgi:hypothetical protein
MGSKGDCFDNAVAESFFATLEKDLLRRRSFATRQDARTAVFDYIETFYHPDQAPLSTRLPVTGRVREDDQRRESRLINRVHRTGDGAARGH